MSNNEWWMRELYGREKIALPNGKRIMLIKELIVCGALDEFFLEEVLPEHADAGLQRYLQLTGLIQHGLIQLTGLYKKDKLLD
jgi:hypothetical protein